MEKNWAPFLLILLLVISCTGNSYKTCNKQGLIAQHGMVVSAHPLASQVGVDILKKGGNAIDAAIGVQFALAVVLPWAGNIGGGGFMVIRKNDGEISALDYREKAPLSGGRNMYLDSLGNVIEEASTHGHLAVGVPGSVAGMVEAHKKFGLLPWADLVQPAIDLAKNGFALTEQEAQNLNEAREDFIQYNTIIPDFLLKAGNWTSGDTIIMNDLAHTLERIRDRQKAGFYQGETARLLLGEMKRGHGLITQQDLDEYEAIWRTPVAGKFKSFRVISMPPPSSGGIALLQLLKMTTPYPMAKMGWNTAETVHLMTEAERRVYADRAKHLGDPDFWPVPVQQLLDDQYLKKRMASYDPKQATPSDSILAGDIPYQESTQTTHFSVVDREGNAVAVTTTLNGGFGSKVVVHGAGFFLNNEMDDFSVKPGVPNMYGLVGGEANAIAPGKRMLSSMTPTIVEKNGRLFMVVGTPGGSTIITSVFQTILNVIEYDMTMEEAVSAKRFHHQWKPDIIAEEAGAIARDDSTILVRMGHKLEDWHSIGRVDAILMLNDSTMEGGADPRGDDTAIGY